MRFAPERPGLRALTWARNSSMPKDDYLDDPAFPAELENLQACLRAHPTLRSLTSSAWFSQNRNRIERILDHSHVENSSFSPSPGKPWLRCLSWNIEKGTKLDMLIEIFRSDRRFLSADLILLQEADLGMARSGNRFVARELARTLDMNFAFAPCFIELTKGAGEDLKAAGENSSGLQGNAILSRFPIQSARTIRLPQCFEPFEFSEKRYGNRAALICQFDIGGRKMMAATTHLEVRNSPRCRAEQMAALIGALKEEARTTILIGGDFNSNTFPRGTAWRTLRSLFRLMTVDPANLVGTTLSPQAREPLFDVLSHSGFEWKPFNDSTATAATFLRSLEDVHLIPRFLRDRASRTLKSFEKGLPLRLDWFVGKNISPVVPLSRRESMVHGLDPISPMTITEFENGVAPENVSDHRPILVDLAWDP